MKKTSSLEITKTEKEALEALTCILVDDDVKKFIKDFNLKISEEAFYKLRNKIFNIKGAKND